MATILEWKEVERHFRPAEFAHESDGVTVEEAKKGMNICALLPLYDLRCYLGCRIIILSGFAKTGHSSASQHYKGNAYDIWVDGIYSSRQLFELYLEVERWGKFKGIGIYPNWKILKTGEPRPGLHLDVGWRPDTPPDRGARWGCWISGEYVNLDTEFIETLLNKI